MKSTTSSLILFFANGVAIFLFFLATGVTRWNLEGVPREVPSFLVGTLLNPDRVSIATPN